MSNITDGLHLISTANFKSDNDLITRDVYEKDV